MTIQRLIDILNGSGTDGWELTQTVSRGWEFYFIRHLTDQNRCRDIETFRVKVFKLSPDREYLGSASGTIPPQADDREAAEIIDNLMLSASFVRNPVYTLRPAAGTVPAGPGAPDAGDTAAEFLGAMAGIAETPTEDINSFELFTTRKTIRLVTSEGIDLTADVSEAMLEAVINARKTDGTGEIELYRLYRSGGCDKAALEDDIGKAMRYGRDKLTAEKTPALGKADVVLSTDAAIEVYYWFIDRMNAAYKVRGWSDWTLGTPIDPGCTGDRITVRSAAALPNSSENLPFDPEGAPRRDMVIIRDNVPENYYGSRQFSQYLGLTDSFIPGNFTVEGGTASEEEIREGRYLEVVEFSDFQVDALTGDIAGEIRLAYWHDGTAVRAVSGGSVSGNMKELVKTMRCTERTRQYNSLVIPAVTRLRNATVTGAA